MKNSILYLCFAVLAGVVTNCNVPKDTNDSWNDALSNGLRVGLVATSTSTTHERKLLADFAAKHRLQLNIVRGSESELISQLKDYHIHILAGRLDDKNPWQSKAAMTKTYDNIHVFMVPKGEHRLLMKLDEFIDTKKH